jgi:signal transduction histidine kinase
LKVECERFSRQESIKVEGKIDDVPRHVPQDVALCLFRVTQEALHNVSRHAQATMVDVSLRQSEAGLELTVTDNGVGFQSAEELQRPTLGLSSMRERVRLLGGRMTVQSEPNRGTTLSVWVPLKEINGRSRAQKA